MAVLTRLQCAVRIYIQNNNNLQLEGEEDTVQLNIKYALKNFELKL